MTGGSGGSGRLAEGEYRHLLNWEDYRDACTLLSTTHYMSQEDKAGYEFAEVLRPPEGFPKPAWTLHIVGRILTARGPSADELAKEPDRRAQLKRDTLKRSGSV